MLNGMDARVLLSTVGSMNCYREHWLKAFNARLGLAWSNWLIEDVDRHF